jgi:hypothetical protein
MGGIYKVCCLGGLIWGDLMKITADFQDILLLYLKNLRCCSVGITDGEREGRRF